jgi:hypothetical protein
MSSSYKNLSATASVKTGFGKLKGMYVNSTNAGTIKFNDGTSGTASAGVKATGVLTGSDVFTDGEVVVIGSETYTMVDALTNLAKNEVLIGTLAETLDNLKEAINGGTGMGTVYSYGTTAHPTVTATTNTATAQTVEAKVVGVVGNSIATTTDAEDVAWGEETLESGVDVNVLINNTITPAIGYHNLGDASFTAGCYATIAGTALNVTIYYE